MSPRDVSTRTDIGVRGGRGRFKDYDLAVTTCDTVIVDSRCAVVCCTSTTMISPSPSSSFDVTNSSTRSILKLLVSKENGNRFEDHEI